MRIMYLASEAQPFIKTGGLADVMYALPKAMCELGHEVTVILPKYDKIIFEDIDRLEYVDSIDMQGEIYNLLKYNIDNITYYFIENRVLYERGHIYGDLDEDVQYANFCEIVLRFMKKLDIKVDIVHCNDWQTGPFSYFMKTRYMHEDIFNNIKVIYTIHNLMYQGRFNNYSFEKLGYEYDNYTLNFMEIGMSYADVVNTVSPTYAIEIKYPYFSEGLEWITNSIKIYGVLNGIDYDIYNPRTTNGIIPFNTDIKEYKRENKKKLLRFFALEDNDDMVISIVSRLVEGKGLDLVISRIEELIKTEDVKFIVLGTGSRYYEDFFNHLSYKYPSNCKVYIGYNEKLANLIYAGSDLFLMPSRYEPCGLSQMIAMRFGTIPLVRETGGLKDTVTAYNHITNEGNGFSFTNFNADDMLHVIRYANNIYSEQKDVWYELIKKNMKLDFSWSKSAKEYEKLYKNARNN